jgi:serine/threonine-protein kinase
MIGQTVSHYKVLDKLGEGGMGVVYRARDTHLGRCVALKFLSEEVSGQEAEKTRFLHEAQAAASLNHPNVCTIHEIAEHEGRPFIAMECVEGESLKDKLDKGPLPIEQALDIAIQVACGLLDAHDKGLIHRDIKPGNIMLSESGQAKIMDFGLVRLPDRTRVTKTGFVAGTMAYMSPEQGLGKEVDCRTDLWSLGVVLYEMIGGRIPFHSDYEQATVYLILNEEPEPVTSLRPDVPLDLERILHTALAKEPSERYKSAQDFRADLLALAGTDNEDAGSGRRAIQQATPSVAVLRFADLSPQKDQDYFCEGIAEELINALTKIEGLKVAARTSTFRFPEQVTDIRKVGRELGVGNVLEGSVRTSRDRLRITAKLVNTRDGFHLWSEQYDRDVSDIFSIQDEISLAIVGNLRGTLLGKERKALMKRHTRDQRAHNLYLKGLYFWNRRLEGGLKRAMEYFRRAVEKDPHYALAHVGIADTFNLLGFFGYVPPEEAFPRAKAAAHEALEVDEALGEAHASLGFAITHYDWDWQAAEREFKHAIKLNPSHATVHQWYSLVLAATGRLEEAVTECKWALQLDPLSLIINALVGVFYYFSGDHDACIKRQQRALEMEPSFLLSYVYIALAYAAKNSPEQVVATGKKAEALASDNSYALALLGWAYGESGNGDAANRILERLHALSKERYVAPSHQAVVLAALGRRDDALAQLEKACAAHDPLLISVKSIPVAESLHADERFRALYEKSGLA